MNKTPVTGNLSGQSVLARMLTFSWLKRSTIVETIAILFVILFLYTGISKLMEYSVFKEQLAESPVLKPVASLVAWGLPVTEFLVAFMLFTPRFRLKGLYVALVLMIAFTIYIAALLTFSDQLPCSCGGVLQQLSWPAHLVFNGAWILLALAGIITARRMYR